MKVEFQMKKFLRKNKCCLNYIANSSCAVNDKNSVKQAKLLNFSYLLKALWNEEGYILAWGCLSAI